MESRYPHIDALKQELESLPEISTDNRRKLDQKIRLEFNYNSNHIEGNTLTYGETQLLLMFGKTSGDHEIREFEEMQGHDLAFELIKEWSQDQDRHLSESDLRTLNEVILVRPFWKEAVTADGQSTRRKIKVGEYKEYPNTVRLQNGEIFHYTTPEETPSKMQDLIVWLRYEESTVKLHPIELAAIFYHKFVLIHPFDDGNGRVSRLVMNYILMKNGYPPVVIKSADKKEYLNALNQADVGNMQAFVDYIAKETKWSFDLYIKATKGEELKEQKDWEKELSVLAKVGEKAPAKRNFDLTADRWVESIFPLVKTISESIESSLGKYFDSFEYEVILIKDKAKLGLTPRIKLIDRSKITSHLIRLNEEQKMYADFVFKNYLKNGISSFDIKLSVYFNFYDYSYSIGILGWKDFKIEKSIELNITNDEVEQIVNHLGEEALKTIKSKIQN